MQVPEGPTLTVRAGQHEQLPSGGRQAPTGYTQRLRVDWTALGRDKEGQLVNRDDAGTDAPHCLGPARVRRQRHLVVELEGVGCLTFDRLLELRQTAEGLAGIAEQRPHRAPMVLPEQERMSARLCLHGLEGSDDGSDAALAGLDPDHDGRLGIPACSWGLPARVLPDENQVVLVHGETIRSAQEGEPCPPRREVTERSQPAEELSVLDRLEDVHRSPSSPSDGPGLALPSSARCSARPAAPWDDGVLSNAAA